MTSSQTEQIYERLRAAILALDLVPGERLTERDLESRFAASRTPVRAALLKLDAEGLVQRGERGFAVAPIDLAEIAWVAELREGLEPAAVRLAVERASDADIRSLAALFEHQDAPAEVRANGTFHEQLARLSGNPLIVETVKGALTRIERTRWLDVRSEETRERAWQEHRAVAHAVERRDADAAAGLIADHIRHTNARLIKFLESEHPELRARGLSVGSRLGTEM